jgi:hypothetical protein
MFHTAEYGELTECAQILNSLYGDILTDPFDPRPVRSYYSVPA